MNWQITPTNTKIPQKINKHNDNLSSHQKINKHNDNLPSNLIRNSIHPIFLGSNLPCHRNSPLQ